MSVLNKHQLNELAAKFEQAGYGNIEIAPSDLELLGLQQPKVYKSPKHGIVKPSDGWESFCVWVFESLTNQNPVHPGSQARGRGFRSQAFAAPIVTFIKALANTAPCDHNVMVGIDGDKLHAWKCADCGYIYGKNKEDFSIAETTETIMITIDESKVKYSKEIVTDFFNWQRENTIYPIRGTGSSGLGMYQATFHRADGLKAIEFLKTKGVRLV